MFGLLGAAGQAIVPPEIQGRVFALHSSVANLVAPLGLMVAGPVADALGVQFWWLLTGVAITAIALAALAAPPVVNIEEYPRPAVA